MHFILSWLSAKRITLTYLFISIEFKHGFPCVNIYRVSKKMLKTRARGEILNSFRGTRKCQYLESHARSLPLCKNLLLQQKSEENATDVLIFFQWLEIRVKVTLATLFGKCCFQSRGVTSVLTQTFLSSRSYLWRERSKKQRP